MRNPQALWLGAIFTVLFGLFILMVGAGHTSSSVIAAETGAATVFGIRSAHWGSWRGRGAARFCSEDVGARIDEMSEFVQGFTEFTPEQDARWSDLTTSLKAGAGSFRDVCADFVLSAPQTAPERLAALEAALMSGLEALQEVRPSFDAFYATLDEEQRALVDRLGSRRHRI